MLAEVEEAKEAGSCADSTADQSPDSPSSRENTALNKPDESAAHNGDAISLFEKQSPASGKWQATDKEIEMLCRRSPYVAADLGVAGAPDGFYHLAKRQDSRILDLIESVVDLEGPIHADLMAKRIGDAFSLTRCGHRIRNLVNTCIAIAERRGTLVRKGNFVWRAKERPVAVRSNEGSDAPRSPDQIPIEEVIQRIIEVVEAAHGAQRNDVVIEVARVFGFARTGSKIRGRIEAAIEVALNTGSIVDVGEGMLVAPLQS